MRVTAGVLAATLALSGTLFAQQSATAAAGENVTPVVDAKLHASVMKLLEVTNVRAIMLAAQEKMLPETQSKMREMVPGISQEFLDEWSKRMMAPEMIEEYASVVAPVYEKHFTNEEVLELIQGTQDKNDGKTPTLSDALKAKFAKGYIDIQSEIMGACAQLGSKRGAEIAEQLGKEHPEWIKEAAATGTPGAKK